MFQWISAAARRVETWHEQTVILRWPYQPAMTKPLLLAIVALATLAILMNMQVRNAQYQAWKTFHSGDDTLLFSTTDAPYFLGLAGALQRGETNADYESLLSYPDNMRKAQETPDAFNDASPPLLSVLLSWVAPSDKPAELLKTGHLFVVICSGITAGLIILAFAAAGYGLEGAIAATGAGLSAAYLVRSSAGRIDTDMLNMGLLYASFGAAILAGRAMSPRQMLVWCVVAGGIARVFLAWYDRSQLIWLVLAALIWLMVVSRRGPLAAMAGIVLFILVSGMDFFNPFSSGYLADTLDFAAFTFPNTLSTITEATTLTLSNAMIQATGSIEMGLVCLAGLGLWATRHPAMAVAMSPLLALGLLNFIIGNRFIFYATPILWFGFGYLLTLMAGFIQRELTIIKGGAPLARTAMPAVVTLMGLTIAWANTPTKFVPRVTFPNQALMGFASLDGQFNPADTVVATWWDYGYASTFLNKLPVLHYGGAVNTAATHIVASALLDDDQTASIGRLKYLSTDGSRGINSQPSTDALIKASRDAAEKPSPDLLLVITNQMAGWMGSISKIGNWNIETGEPILLRGNPDGAEVHYKPINCRFNAYPQHLDCNGAKIDLERGLIDGKPLLVGWTHTQNGEILRRRGFDHDADHAIQIVQNGGRITAYLLHRQLYESTFNKLYYQGLMEHPAISLHYDDYPHIRIYRIDGTPGG